MKVYLGRYKNPRKVEVRIDKWDIWGLDHTLALIIHPALVLLKANKHGAPMVDDSDVPDELKSTNAGPKENDWDTDDNHFLRWDWVLDEMIWTFGKLSQNDYESEYFTVNPETGKYSCDNDGIEEMEKRINRGLTLFGKYYRALWD